MSALAVFAVLAAIAAVAAAWYAFQRYQEVRADHARVRSLFSRYVPPQVVEELLARKDPRLFEAREYYATILCARIRNFALLAEQLTPEETLRYLNEFYTIAGQAVARHRGMIESLRGDTVTAIFGVLIEEQFQEERALRASLDIMRVMHAMEARWSSQGRKALCVGIGVNSGKVVAGDTGNAQRREFAVVGNAAHVASQLETASEELNAAIVASDNTLNPVRELFVAVPAASVPLRGLRRLQNAYIIRGLTKRAAPESRLTLPSQGSFKETTVRSYEAPEAPEAASRPYVAPAPPPEKARYDAAKQTTSAVDEMVTALAPVERPRFSAVDDDALALPELPPILGTYEDDEGPPYQLPP